jgi:hypothetical protein
MFNTSKRCFCAFCRSERVVYRKKHISLIDGSLAAAASFLLGFIVWQDFDPRILMFFAFGLGLAELFIQVRWRLSIACPHCGFDPVLYKRNKPLAAERVRAFLEIRREDPMSAFSPLNLPHIIKKAGEGATKKTSAVAKPPPQPRI